MNLAKQLYKEALENKFKGLPDAIKEEINASVGFGDLGCRIDEIELVERYKDTLEELGIKVEYRVDEHWGEIMGKYYYISWDMKENE